MMAAGWIYEVSYIDADMRSGTRWETPAHSVSLLEFSVCAYFGYLIVRRLELRRLRPASTEPALSDSESHIVLDGSESSYTKQSADTASTLQPAETEEHTSLADSHKASPLNHAADECEDETSHELLATNRTYTQRPGHVASRECPFCAETIKARARICKHCKSEVPPNQQYT